MNEIPEYPNVRVGTQFSYFVDPQLIEHHYLGGQFQPYPRIEFLEQWSFGVETGPVGSVNVEENLHTGKTAQQHEDGGSQKDRIGRMNMHKVILAGPHLLEKPEESLRPEKIFPYQSLAPGGNTADLSKISNRYSFERSELAMSSITEAIPP